MTKANIILLIVLAIVIIGGAAYALTRSEPQEAPTANESENTAALDAACEGALAYMSFPDGAAADAFVTECKAGMHPEVLDPAGPEMELN